MLRHDISFQELTQRDATLTEAEIKPVRMYLKLVSILKHNTNKHMQCFLLRKEKKKVSNKSTTKNHGNN